MNDSLTNVLVALVTGLVTFFVAKTQSQHSVHSKKIETDSTTEGMYAKHMSTVLSEYKEQVSGFRLEVSELRDENKRLKQEFKQFKLDAESIREKERAFYTTEIEKRDDRIEELETIVVEKDEYIEILKGDI